MDAFGGRNGAHIEPPVRHPFFRQQNTSLCGFLLRESLLKTVRYSQAVFRIIFKPKGATSSLFPGIIMPNMGKMGELRVILKKVLVFGELTLYRFLTGKHGLERGWIILFNQPFSDRRGSCSGYWDVNLYCPFGTVISNRAPFPGSPVSVIVILVISRISRTRKSPTVLFF